MTTSSPTGSYFSPEELRRNVPNRPDTFVPQGPRLKAIRDYSMITSKLVELRRVFRAVSPRDSKEFAWTSAWTYGLDADGGVIGERWSTRDGVRVVVDECRFSNEAELRSYATWALTEHWYVPRVIPSRLDA